MTAKNDILLRMVARVVLVVMVFLAAGGCGLAGAFYGVFIHPLLPPVKVAAEHDMSNHKVLVWVDTIGIDQGNHLLRRELTLQLQQELLNNNAVTAVVEYQQISRFRREYPQFVDLTIQQLGQGLAADEVLYLLIDKFQLNHEAGKGYYQTSLTGYSKVIDTSTGKRLWPIGQANRLLAVEGDFAQGQGENMERRMVKDVCREGATQVARFFYEHHRPR